MSKKWRDLRQEIVKLDPEREERIKALVEQDRRILDLLAKR